MDYITYFLNKETYICCYKDDDKKNKYPIVNPSKTLHYMNSYKKSPKPYKRENSYIERKIKKNSNIIEVKCNDAVILY